MTKPSLLLDAEWKVICDRLRKLYVFQWVEKGGSHVPPNMWRGP